MSKITLSGMSNHRSKITTERLQWREPTTGTIKIKIYMHYYIHARTTFNRMNRQSTECTPSTKHLKTDWLFILGMIRKGRFDWCILFPWRFVVTKGNVGNDTFCTRSPKPCSKHCRHVTYGFHNSIRIGISFHVNQRQSFNYKIAVYTFNVREEFLSSRALQVWRCLLVKKEHFLVVYPRKMSTSLSILQVRCIINWGLSKNTF